MRSRRLTLLAAAALLALATLDAPARAQDNAAPLVAIDPGHGGDDYGTNGVVNGRRLLEKELTLQVARQTAENLKAAGYRTLLLRTEDGSVNRAGRDRTGDGKVDLADELQARVDRANEAGAAVLVSVHFNGSTDRSLRGPEVYYSAARPFAAENRKLAERVMAAITDRLAQANRPVTPHGILRDSVLGGSLYLLGPQGGRIVRASSMPGILIEGMFLTNAEDAALLADPVTLGALARAYADGVAGYLGPPPKPKPRLARVVGDGANLRPSPLLGTEPLTVLAPGTTVDLAEATRGDAVGGAADWWRVNVKGQAGYVFAALLDLQDASTAPPKPPAAVPGPVGPGNPTPARRVRVRNDDGRAARLRAGPTRETEIIVRARPGETLELLGQADGEAVDGKVARWLKVRRGDLTGWVWAPLVDG
ncbi:MAG TPA: N-acetylmuramoyl-L-alanine amidase [Chloroflexota bacterium]